MDEFAAERLRMVAEGLAGRDVRDPRVLQALREIPRHRFVPPEQRVHAYADTPLPIGAGQTISQPYMVGKMTELLALTGAERVLEIGTGSGYQTALLCRLAARIYTVERLPELQQRALALLAALGQTNVTARLGDGHQGWPEEAPFDAILVTAAPTEVPPALVTQLAPGGRLVLPVGERWSRQVLVRLRRAPTGELTREELFPVSFVPLVAS
ncbi:MAG: protein-L-isoaspartate(D-aspartate) O-methyltransferase [Myxococcota bacterium]|jgi:protein-L-isoaspartate(D-aspartate) O-methyltransferase|nr:protein-L-isoaspartate(D-aspartate) O-methyltransferase [Myxococcota bacterium]